jgi:chromosome partitioning protein
MTEKLPLTLAILNNKGGVGKTTTAVNLGAALASPRRRVLLIDLDSQASASIWCGIRRGRLKPSSASVLLHDFPVEQAIRSTPTPHLDIITGSIELANADLALSDVKGRETTLKHALRGLPSTYGMVVLDCPPSLSLVGVNALVAADAVLIPVPPQSLAVEGLGSLVASIDTVRRRLGAQSRMLGVLITMSGQRSGEAKRIRQRIRAEYRDGVFRTEVESCRALEEAPAVAKTIFAFAPRSRAADAFRHLAVEVLERLRPGRR